MGHKISELDESGQPHKFCVVVKMRKLANGTFDPTKQRLLCDTAGLMVFTKLEDAMIFTRAWNRKPENKGRISNVLVYRSRKFHWLYYRTFGRPVHSSKRAGRAIGKAEAKP